MIKSTEKTVKVSALKPFDGNPRRNSENAFNRLKRSLSESGDHQPIIATKRPVCHWRKRSSFFRGMFRLTCRNATRVAIGG